MSPFWCLVTILNTKDHLEKLDGKADEGFFVGYSLNSKAFRVFNNRTRIVEENLHIKFNENTSNIAECEPNWLFDIDTLTKLMNYKPVVVGNQSNGNAVNVVGANTNNKLPFDPEMRALEDISIFNFSSDHEDDDEEVDMNNMNTTIQVNPTLTTRIHKDHPLDQVIGEMHSTTQTRKMSKNFEEHGFVTTMDQRTNHKDLQNYLFACFLSQKEPQKYALTVNPTVYTSCIELFWATVKVKTINGEGQLQVLVDEKKIEEEVYVCQPIGFEDPDFPDKVYKVEKALYGLHQASKAWYETLSMYLLDNGFHRGKIDKTLFIRRHNDEILLVQVYVDDIISVDEFQPLSNDGKKVDDDPRQESECNDQEKEDNVNNTNNVNAVGTNRVNTVGANTNNELLFDPEMPALKDINTFNFLSDHENDDEMTYINNLDTRIQVSPTLTTRIHKDHPLD
nr:ribonuclease H-like domain-containing protein [Tanacetum cinerariifolium]